MLNTPKLAATRKRNQQPDARNLVSMTYACFSKMQARQSQQTATNVSYWETIVAAPDGEPALNEALDLLRYARQGSAQRSFFSSQAS